MSRDVAIDRNAAIVATAIGTAAIGIGVAVIATAAVVDATGIATARVAMIATASRPKAARHAVTARSGRIVRNAASVPNVPIEAVIATGRVSRRVMHSRRRRAMARSRRNRRATPSVMRSAKRSGSAIVNVRNSVVASAMRSAKPQRRPAQPLALRQLP